MRSLAAGARPLRVAAVALCGSLCLSSSFGGWSEVQLDCPMPVASLGSFVHVDGGGFVRGAAGVYEEEGPAAKVYVSPFLIQAHEVTNEQFTAFVEATGYVTDAERGAGSARFVPTTTPDAPQSWWSLDTGVTWSEPQGQGSDLDGKGRHPVVHVSLHDARAYAAWAGGRLPSETEWEYAASLGLFEPSDPESGFRGPDGRPRANVWTGDFPRTNTEEDGYAGTAPAGCFEASLIGVYDMIGNVWEWTETPFGRGSPVFTIKGGSYLCSPDHCRRYRPAARQSMESNFSSAHVGFRLVKDLEAALPPEASGALARAGE